MAIGKRLENWARAQRAGQRGSDGLTATIYFQSIPGRSIDPTLDVEDANRVEMASRKLMPLDRKVLQLHFVWRARPEVICRRLGLRVRPASIFDLALAHAMRALEEKLVEPSPRYVSMQSIVDRMKESVAESK
ncbi:hypothetical protein [Burkholderia ambifaria]|jgi:hypothetical protein|uniref:hypothetical protein n=1 Tax=Burkholderia ambifaria TaxID=152480 RepID=UPI00158D3096|nr:hypothetical protein [Burkholderia ambifaria]